MEPTPGSLFADRYRVVREVERGPTSVVFEAEDTDLGRTVALKVPTPEADAQRFREEARTDAARDDPNVCRVFDFGETSSGPYVVTELVPGGTLDTRVASTGAFVGETTVAAPAVQTAPSGRRWWRPNRRAAAAAGALGSLALAAYGLAAFTDRGHADEDESPTAPRKAAPTTTGEQEAGKPTAREPAFDEETGGASITDQPATTTDPRKPKPSAPVVGPTTGPPSAPPTQPPATSEELTTEQPPPEPAPTTTETTPPAPTPSPPREPPPPESPPPPPEPPPTRVPNAG